MDHFFYSEGLRFCLSEYRVFCDSAMCKQLSGAESPFYFTVTLHQLNEVLWLGTQDIQANDCYFNKSKVLLTDLLELIVFQVKPNRFIIVAVTGI